jgi:hypothetical protein
MKIDATAIAILLFFVTPGYLTYWVRNHFVPRSLAARGATEEIAGFVVASALVHCLLGLFVSLGFALHGAFQNCDVLSDFQWINTVGLEPWWLAHPTNGIALAIGYLLLSACLGAALGVPLALLSLRWKSSFWGSLQTAFHDNGTWLRRHGIRGLIAEQPAIYTALRPTLAPDGSENLVIIEAELRDSKGFYIGQVASYSIARDEEPHKIVLVRNAQFSQDNLSEYGPIQPGTLLIDLADVLTLKISQVPAIPNPPPIPVV